jgi:hypothetical protein
MYRFMSLERSDLPTKKWRANFFDKENNKRKTVNFGARNFRDFTTIDDRVEANKARDAYRARHAGDNLTDPLSPGALSWWILWGDYNNVSKNLGAYRRHFKI